MKKILYLALVSAFILASCSDSDDDGKKNNGTTENGSGENGGNNNGSGNNGSGENGGAGENGGSGENNGTGEDNGAVDFGKFCDRVMGKACGYSIDDSTIKWCEGVYADELNSHKKCETQLTSYYKCVSDIKVECSGENCDCIPDDACKAEIDSASACLASSYPEEAETESVDFEKFCNVVMGKVCGYDISDGTMAQCVDVYSNEAVTYKDCKDVADAYYKCVIDTDEGYCNPSSIPYCNDEIEAYSSCMATKHPETQVSGSDIDFGKFCVNVMGKSCGADISDADIDSCEMLYADEYRNHQKCGGEIKAYSQCLAEIVVTPCEDPNDDNCACMDALDDEACMSSFDKASDCLMKSYPLEFVDDIDFDGFCNVIMGKACGYSIDDASMKWCADTYKAEFKAYSGCALEMSKYYDCVGNIETKTCSSSDPACECFDDNACKSEIENVDKCLNANYRK